MSEYGPADPRPARGAGRNRLELCMELISKAKECLNNDDKECTMRILEELVKADCHNGHAVGKEVADKVKGVVHELWLRSDNRCRCELLRMLRDLGISKGWVRSIFNTNTKMLNKWLVKCGISWEGRMSRNDIVKEIEDLLRERLGWSEVRMCEEMWRLVGVDVDEFRRHGIETCIWLEGINELSNLRNPYWLGLRASDLAIEEYDGGVRLELKTTNTIDAVFFVKLLSTVKTPSLAIEWIRNASGAKYVRKAIALEYYVDLDIDKWPWPELSADELEKILNSLSDEGLAMFVAGMIDGDGSVRCVFEDGNVHVYVEIATCKSCPKRMNLDVLRDTIAERFGIVGRIYQLESADVLRFHGEKAVRLLRRIIKYMHHPLKRLRAELILALHDGKISKDELIKLYVQTEYERGRDDIKRNRGLEVLARAAPQTHTHGVGS